MTQVGTKIQILGEVVVAQLVEQSLPTPGIRGLNPDVGKIKSTNCTIEKTKIKKKRPGMGHLFKKIFDVKGFLHSLQNTIAT